MNLSPLWVEFLAEHGMDAFHWSTVGRPDAPDADLMLWAAQQQCVLVTQDLDFGLLLAQSGDHGPSVIQIRAQGTFPSDFGRALIAAISAAQKHLEQGALVTIELGCMRVRALPFG